LTPGLPGIWHRHLVNRAASPLPAPAMELVTQITEWIGTFSPAQHDPFGVVPPASTCPADFVPTALTSDVSEYENGKQRSRNAVARLQVPRVSRREAPLEPSGLSPILLLTLIRLANMTQPR